MITNFEEHTEDLSEIEMKFCDDVKEIIISCLSESIYVEVSGGKPILIKQKPTRKPIKQKELAEIVNFEMIKKHGLFVELTINHVRLRKYFNYFRTNGIIPIIATSQGCYISTDKTEIEKQIKSLQERARQINQAAIGMQKFLI